MSRASKSRAKEERLKKKRDKKRRMQEQYAKYRELGQNSKRSRIRSSKKAKIPTISHPNGPCGNIGCKKCNVINFKPFLKDNKPYLMPHWMYKRWLDAAA